MSVEVRIPAVLRKHVGGQRSIEIDGGVLRELFEKLGTQYPGFDKEIFDESGGLHRFVNVYLNDEDVRYLEGLETKIADGDVVAILPAVAGGAAPKV